MRKHGGTLIHCYRDDEGLVEVVEAHGTRSLHFGTSPKQSAMSLAEPERLELTYVRAMLAGLMFTKDPERILLLGLGGGSLAKFLLRNFPECRIDAVESRAVVATVARRFFGLPDDPRLTIHIADAGEFLRSAISSDIPVYSHVFVDIFDREGLAIAATRPDFIAAGARLVGDRGMLAMNLWASHPSSLRLALDLLKPHFAGQILRLHVPGRGNVIAFGLGQELQPPRRNALMPRARDLEQQLGLEFPRLLHLLSLPAQ